MDDDDATPCATLDCPNSTARYGCYCGDCLKLRHDNYSDLVAGTAYIRIEKTVNGMERRVIHKQ